MSRPTRATAAGRAYLDLQNRARRDGRGTQELLTMYVVERWLARLSRSPYVNDFVLKGGMLLAALGSRRPTVDVDALARHQEADQQSVAARVAQIAALPDVDDGVTFLIDTLTAQAIREDARYGGVRVTLTARLGTAVVKLRLDVNFGDPVTPAPRLIRLPGLRPGANPILLLGYPIETVLAEKLATAIELGAANTRVRNSVDLYTLTGLHSIDRDVAQHALAATAQYRGTTLVPLTRAIGRLAAFRSSAYNAYRKSLGNDGHHLPDQFSDLIDAVGAFADPLVENTSEARSWDARRRDWGPRPADVHDDGADEDLG